MSFGLLASAWPEPPAARAAILRKLPFSASLKTPSGTIVADGNYTIQFNIYTVATGGTAIWSETQVAAVQSGVISVNLGDVTPIPSSLSFNDGAYYLGVKVGSDPEATPRRLIGAVPISLNADAVDGADAGTSAGNVLLLDGNGGIAIQGGFATTANPQPSATTALVGLGSAAITGGSASGTFIGVNTSGAFSGNFIDMQSAGTRKFRVDSNGFLAGGSFIPLSDNLYDLGSASFRFANAYINNLVVGSTSTSGTTSASWTINDDAGGDENSSLIFYRGGVLPSAQIAWDATADYITVNQPLKQTSTHADADGLEANFTLANDAGIDTVAGIDINVTSAATGDADVLQGLNIANLSSPDATVVERALQIGSGWDANLFFNDTSTIIQIADGGSYAFQDAGGNSLLTLADAGATGNLTVSGTINTATISGGTLSGGTVSGGSLSATAVNGLSLASGVISSQLSVSTAGAANTPGAIFTGAWFTGGSSTSTKPQLLVEPSGATSTGWNTGGTGLGVNASSGFAGNLVDLQVNGASKLAVSAAGLLTSVGVSSSGAITGSVTGANALALTGAPAASATSSLIQLGNAIVGGSANGTFIGLNSAAGYTGNLVDYQVNGTSKYKIDYNGNVTQGGTSLAIVSDNVSGTGSSASLSVTANSLTSGQALSVSSTSLSTGSLVDISVASTAANSNTQKAINIAVSGANSNTNQSTYGLYTSNTHTGTGAINYGLYATASGGATNFGGFFSNGNANANIGLAIQWGTGGSYSAFSTLGSNIGPQIDFDNLDTPTYNIAYNSSGGFFYLNKKAGGNFYIQDGGTTFLTIAGNSTDATATYAGTVTYTSTGFTLTASSGTGTIQSSGALALQTTASNSNISVTPNGSGDIRIITSGNSGTYLYIGDGGTTNYAQFDTTGAVSFAGTARPYGEIILTPDDVIYPGSAFCATATNAGTNHTYRSVDCGDGSGNTDEAAFWQLKMPQNYASATNVQVDIYWMTSLTSGKVDWEPGYVVASPDTTEDFDAGSRTDITGQTGSTVNGTANAIKTSTYTFTSPAIGPNDAVSLRINRDASDTTEDTLAGDAKIVKIRVRFLVSS